MEQPVPGIRDRAMDQTQTPPSRGSVALSGRQTYKQIITGRRGGAGAEACTGCWRSPGATITSHGNGNLSANRSELENQTLPLPANNLSGEGEFSSSFLVFCRIYAQVFRSRPQTGDKSGLKATLELVRYWEAVLQGACPGGTGSGVSHVAHPFSDLCVGSKSLGQGFCLHLLSFSPIPS